MSKITEDDKLAAKFDEIARILRMITRGKHQFYKVEEGKRADIYMAIQSLYVDVDYLMFSAQEDLDRINGITQPDGAICACEPRQRLASTCRPSKDVLKFVENIDRKKTK